MEGRPRAPPRLWLCNGEKSQESTADLNYVVAPGLESTDQAVRSRRMFLKFGTKRGQVEPEPKVLEMQSRSRRRLEGGFVRSLRREERCRAEVPSVVSCMRLHSSGSLGDSELNFDISRKIPPMGHGR